MPTSFLAPILLGHTEFAVYKNPYPHVTRDTNELRIPRAALVQIVFFRSHANMNFYFPCITLSCVAGGVAHESVSS